LSADTRSACRHRRHTNTLSGEINGGGGRESAVWVCLCFAVTDAHIREVIREGATTEEEIAAVLGAGTNCANCLPAIRECLRATSRTGA